MSFPRQSHGDSHNLFPGVLFPGRFNPPGLHNVLTKILGTFVHQLLGVEISQLVVGTREIEVKAALLLSEWIVLDVIKGAGEFYSFFKIYI